MSVQRRGWILALVALAASPLMAAEGRKLLFEPTTISDPGSYRLTNDITVSSGSVFEITANNVFIDLDGHKLESTSGDPVVTALAKTGLRITNGIIIGGLTGVIFENSSPAPPIVVQVDRIQFVGQAAAAVHIKGVAMGGAVAVVERNTIDGTGPGGVPTMDNGILVEHVTDSSMSHNVVRGCEFVGIKLDVGGNNRLAGNNASANVANGIAIKGDFNTVTDNTTSASQDGIFVDGDGNTIQYNTASGNTGFGIKVTPAGANNSLDWNVASQNTNCGIKVDGTPNLVTENRLAGNGGACSTNQSPQCSAGPATAVVGISAVAGNLLCGNVGI